MHARHYTPTIQHPIKQIDTLWYTVAVSAYSSAVRVAARPVIDGKGPTTQLSPVPPPWASTAPKTTLHHCTSFFAGMREDSIDSLL